MTNAAVYSVLSLCFQWKHDVCVCVRARTQHPWPPSVDDVSDIFVFGRRFVMSWLRN